MRTNTQRCLASIALITIFACPVVAKAAATPAILNAEGAVYVASNDVHHNMVSAYRRAADGSLTFIHTYSTGGRGSGGTIDPLQSQNSVLVSPDHAWLFVVNSASGDISDFAIHPNGSLELKDVVPSGGGFPVGLAAYGRLLYVLNAGGAGNVTGFFIQRNGTLSPIPNSTELLSSTSAGGASIDFSPDGSVLAATERLNNRIDIFPIEPDGTAGQPVLNMSNGNGVFSLAFTPQGALLTTETAGNPAGGSAISSYAVQSNDALSVISGSAPTGYAAACWIVATSDGHYAYVANAGSGEISEVSVADDGSLTVLGAASSGTASTPLDLALSANDRYLYAVTAGNGQIAEYEVNADGSLTWLNSLAADPAASGQNGIAAF
jgi:6-phosphogluconolactonase (cycloisomerase 2 family)